MAQQVEAYRPTHRIRIVTAASLFDGHDAAINIMRRIMQSSGAEVIHLGHNRSVAEIVQCAVQEDVQAVAVTSYQGGHMEFFTYMHDLLRERGAGHIRIFGGGGGTILPSEIEELHRYGITRIYSPDDGRAMGLQGMINDVLEKSDFETPLTFTPDELRQAVLDRDDRAIAQAISALERGRQLLDWRTIARERAHPTCVLGITGTGGAGKSSLTDEIVRRFLEDSPDRRVGILSVDPSKRKTGGALLGDRIRMNAAFSPRVYMRSFATRQANLALSPYVAEALWVLKAAAFDLIIVETAGIGQSDSQVTEIADIALYVMTPEYGAATQLEKIDMIDYADLIAINKFDKRGALDALRDVRKQYQRSHGLWSSPLEAMPVFGTIASQFNDEGTNALYRAFIELARSRFGLEWTTDVEHTSPVSTRMTIIPPERSRYLAEIVETNKRYDAHVERQAALARRLYQLRGAMEQLLSASEDADSH
ncbi:MAG: ArgK protein [Chlorobi bacterium NICIL-2]|nr:MAG: ArgK protein [Chlorobi bacterium NICIL-2]